MNLYLTYYNSQILWCMLQVVQSLCLIVYYPLITSKSFCKVSFPPFSNMTCWHRDSSQPKPHHFLYSAASNTIHHFHPLRHNSCELGSHPLQAETDGLWVMTWSDRGRDKWEIYASVGLGVKWLTIHESGCHSVTPKVCMWCHIIKVSLWSGLLYLF